MPPVRLLAALLAAHIQLNFGQQINEGNNLIAVASHKLAAIKQQSQQQNVTDTNQTAETEDNLDVKAEQNLEEVHLNASSLFPGGGTITSIRFVPYSAYEGPPRMISVLNSKNVVAVDPTSRSYETSVVDLTNASLNHEQPNTDAGHEVNEQIEENAGSVAKTPVFLSFTPRCSGAMSSQSPYIISGLPVQSTTSNVAAIQTPSPPSKQQSPHTFSSFQFQPSNVQSPANMRLRFVPATAPAQSQNPVPVQNTVPIQNIGPMQNTIPMQNTVPIQNTIPIQNNLPIQKTVSMQNTVPIQRSAIQSAIPIQSTVPLQCTPPIQSVIDNVIQNPNLSVLMAQLLSQNAIKKDYPASTRCVAQDQQQLSKQTTVKTILPLLLQLLTEKNNNCCEYRNKKERSRTYSRYKQGNKKMYDKFEPDFGIRPDSAHYMNRGNQYRKLKKHLDETLEDEDDYSNESSDYSNEMYDDED